jgi:hypothetical protein
MEANEPASPTDPTPPAPSALEELEAWKVRYGVELGIVVISPYGKTAPIEFMLPNGFGADIAILKVEQAQ